MHHDEGHEHGTQSNTLETSINIVECDDSATSIGLTQGYLKDEGWDGDYEYREEIWDEPL